jgi:DNA polymerase bacteriophage-type
VVETYGGALCENVTQAVARDVLVEAMFAAESAGLPTVLHVHDQIICEVPEDQAQALPTLERIMSTSPAWAPSLPVVAKGWCGTRFRKD